MWKKQFYKRVFDRLHNEQWNNKKLTKSSADGNAGSRSRDNLLAYTESPKRRRRGTMPAITVIATREAAARRYLMTHMSREKWAI